VKLRKLKKAQAKASRDARLWTGGVPVMDVRVPGAPSATTAFPASSATATSGDESDDEGPTGDAGDEAQTGDAGASGVADDTDAGGAEAADTGDAERIALAETMYRAAHARLEAAEARELAAAERLAVAEAAERTAAERLAAIEHHELAIAERLAAADDRERAVAERLAAADERERAVAERLAVADIREHAIASLAASAEARERVVAERDAVALQRDRVAVERDTIANERERVAIERERMAAERGVRPDNRVPSTAGNGAASHELEIARLEAELERAHLDSLTGALRREIGRLTLHNEIERARRTDGRFVLAFVDVDDLKGINDREGHAAGDRVLRTLAATLRANLRTYDPVVRYGGDEFVCGVTGVSAAELEHRMTLIDQSLRRATGVGISAGMATLLEGETLDEITARADEALLEAKRNRDR
jgi:diguanylate cyclase (GGDEF)-like protein